MSNETTLDDVLALVRSWRQEASDPAFPDDGDPCAREVLAEHDRTILRCADELEPLLPAIKAALEDARRYRSIAAEAKRYKGDDSPKRLRVSITVPRESDGFLGIRHCPADLTAAIDAAQEVGNGL